MPVCAKLSEPLSDIQSDSLVGFVWPRKKMDIMWVIKLFFLFQLYENKDSKSVTG